MILKSTKLHRWLENAPAPAFSAYCIAAAFTTYFCMYGFRKPFTAATYEQVAPLWGASYKAVAIASQVLGYALSKVIGVKLVSEMDRAWRAAAIVALIAIAHAALLAFAVIPPPYNIVALLLNGLPLGMVFGLVLTCLEGRRTSEALVAGLCGSFIVASGVVKSVGKLLLNAGVAEFWMPFTTGCLFVPPLLLGVWLLWHVPPPTANDVSLRSHRQAMDSSARRAFCGRNALGLTCLLVIFLGLTMIRSVRDDFGVEIWAQLGYNSEPTVYARCEATIAVAVMALSGAMFTIRDNRAALLMTLWAIAGGFLLVAGTLLLFQRGAVSPFAFMVLLGLGMYIPYVVFHTTVFERLIAALGEPGTIGFLMCLADAIGYLAYVGIVIYETRQNAMAGTNINFLEVTYWLSGVVAVISIALSVVLISYYSRHLALPTDKPTP